MDNESERKTLTCEMGHFFCIATENESTIKVSECAHAHTQFITLKQYNSSRSRSPVDHCRMSQHDGNKGAQI